MILITIFILILAYVFIRLRYIKCGRTIFLLIILFELCSIITHMMQFIYQYMFYIMLYGAFVGYLVFKLKKYFTKRKAVCQ